MIQTMQERLLTLEMEKQRLLTLYTENDRRVQDKEQEIEAQRKRLDRGPGADSGCPTARSRSSTTGAATSRRRSSPRALARRRTRSASRAPRPSPPRCGSACASWVWPTCRSKSLLREIQAASEAYLLYRKKAEEARITAAMDENKITNVAIGEFASRQGAPVGPPKNLSLLFAVMVGLVSGVGGAFLREFFDGSIKTEQEIRSSVDLPVLGSIPEEKNGKNGNGNGKNGNGNGKNGNGKNGRHGVEG